RPISRRSDRGRSRRHPRYRWRGGESQRRQQSRLPPVCGKVSKASLLWLSVTKTLSQRGALPVVHVTRALWASRPAFEPPFGRFLDALCRGLSVIFIRSTAHGSARTSLVAA